MVTQYTGEFWLAGDPEEKLPGTLLILDIIRDSGRDIGRIELKLSGPLHPGLHWFSTDLGRTARINGCLEGDRSVTLERYRGCWGTTRSASSLGVELVIDGNAVIDW